MEKKKGHKKTLQNAGLYLVGMARFELATSWSQTRRDNRATLHPELKYLGLIRTFCCGEGGIRTHGTV